MLNNIHCKGSHREIGETHGREASAQIATTIANYAIYFKEVCSMERAAVLEFASQFSKTFQAKVPHLFEEMEGIASGSGQSILDIVLLNARSEIALTAGAAAQKHMVDGCSTFAQKFNGEVWVSQNWDWNSNQRDNLVHLFIEPEGKPKCHVMTEAGLVGKIGINEYGVTNNVNAIKATNLNIGNLPIHVILRVVLEQKSREEALAKLRDLGVASVGHFLISDPTGFTSLITDPSGTYTEVTPDSHGRICHTNHITCGGVSPSINEVFFIADTKPRLSRLQQLVSERITPGGQSSTAGAEAKTVPPSFESILEIMKDEEGAPFGICRTGNEQIPSETIFTIVSNCSKRIAKVTVGRPCDIKERLTLSF